MAGVRVGLTSVCQRVECGNSYKSSGHRESSVQVTHWQARCFRLTFLPTRPRVGGYDTTTNAYLSGALPQANDSRVHYSITPTWLAVQFTLDAHRLRLATASDRNVNQNFQQRQRPSVARHPGSFNWNSFCSPLAWSADAAVNFLLPQRSQVF
jgi:hypothetical protein